MTNVEIQLNPEGTMWFFNDGQYNVHLVYLEGKNKINIDLDSLSDDGLRYLIGSVESRQVLSSYTLSDLYKSLHGRYVVDNPDNYEEVVTDDKLPELQQKAAVQSTIRQNIKSNKQIEALEERCRLLSMSSLKAIKSSLNKEKNQVVLLKVMDLEKAGRNRKAVIKFLTERLDAVRKEKVIEASKSKYTTTDKMPNMGYDVTIEDEEIVEFVLNK